MESNTNLTFEDVLTMIPLMQIEPMFNKVIITLNKEEQDNNLVLSDNVMSEEQFILAKGSMVKDVEVGQKVLLDLEKMMVKEMNPENSHEYIYRVKLDPIKFHDYTFAIIEDRLIKAKYKNQ